MDKVVKKICMIQILFILISSVVIIPLPAAPPESGGELMFQVLPLFVWEGQEFSVRVIGGDVQGVNVTIWVDDVPFYWDHAPQNGWVRLVAPFVSMDQELLLTAKRAGTGLIGEVYTEEDYATAFVLVKDGADSLIINTVSSVAEGQEFLVTVTANNKYNVRNAAVVAQWDPQNIFYTNENGQVFLTAPSVVQNTTYELTATKPQYSTASKNIVIINIMIPLVFQVAPESVAEGSVFSIRITDGSSGVSSVAIIPEWVDSDSYTDASGWATLSAPHVTETRLYSLLAHKPGYLDASLLIEIRHIDLPELRISAPSSVDEAEFFDVTVTDVQGNPSEDAKVTFAGSQQYTNNTGMVTFRAPLVNQNTTYLLTVQKEGYKSTSVSIRVIDIPVTVISEQGVVFGRVIDQANNSVENAQVSVNLKKLGSVITSTATMTNNEGWYLLSLPVGTYTIEASKQGYIKASSTLTIEPTTIEKDFFLIPSLHVQPVDDTQLLIERIIQEDVTQGRIGSRINIEKNDTEIVRYFDDFLIGGFESAENEISFTIINKRAGNPYIVIQSTNPSFSFKESIVSFDGVALEKTTFSEFFDSKHITSVFFEVSVGEVSYVLLRVPGDSVLEGSVLITASAPISPPAQQPSAVPIAFVVAPAVLILLAAAFFMFRKNTSY